MKFLKFIIGAVGGIACLAGAIVAAVALYRSGWLETMVPRVGQPVQIDLFGPGECLAGREYFFHVDVNQPHGPIHWSIAPDVPNALRVVRDGDKASFMTIEPGQYIITVSVAGDGRTVSSDSLIFENLEATEDQEPEAAPVAPINIEALKAAIMPPPEPAPPTIAERIHAAAGSVHSESRGDEARALAGITRSIITRLRDGLIAPDVDVVAELQVQVDLALGEHSRAWDVVLSEVRLIVDDLRQRGHITTAASTQPTLTEIAVGLDSVH